MTELLDEYNRIANNTLNKVFVLKNQSYTKFEIDSISGLLSSEQRELINCKEQVSEKCAEHGWSSWHKHTMFTHPTKNLNRELMADFTTLRPTVSQAYIKFAEILEAYPELTRTYESFSPLLLRTLHLCEAPGCFIQALADYLPETVRTKWLWRVNSLSPYHESAELKKMLFDDSFIAAYIENFLDGPDSTGNLMHFTEDYVASFLGNTGKFQLVTCDGSFDCTDNPANQEASVYPLIMQSWKIAMKCLQKGGSIVIKIYTVFSEDMLVFLNQLCPMFERIYLHKPAASKAGNSEVYLVGINFTEVDIVELISNDLRIGVYEAAKFFAQHQIDMIQFNLASFLKLSQYQRSAVEIKKSEIKAVVKSKLKFIPETVKRGQFLHKLEVNNHWQRAWETAKLKVGSYENYRENYTEPVSFPIKFNPSWPHELLNNFIVTPDTLTSIVHSRFITLSLRSNRLNPLDFMFHTTCSMFADYKLLEFAQNLNITFFDMCRNKKPQTSGTLRHHFSLRNSEVMVDSSLMTKTDWLELCYYAAKRVISVNNIFSTSNIAILLPRPVDQICVDSIRIYMAFGSTLILSRFAGSVIYFLSLFFENVSIHKTNIHFSKRIKSSDNLAEYIYKLATHICSSIDLLQFIPLCMFTNKVIYFKILAFNNHVINDVLQMQAQRQSSPGETSE